MFLAYADLSPGKETESGTGRRLALSPNCMGELHRRGWNMTKEAIASVCHEVNRAYCRALGDFSHLPWNDAPQWQKKSAREGVEMHLNGNVGPEASHKSWMASKLRDGWRYGKAKDSTAKTHPCLMPFDDLPVRQQAKDHICREIVLRLRPFLA